MRGKKKKDMREREHPRLGIERDEIKRKQIIKEYQNETGQ